MVTTQINIDDTLLARAQTLTGLSTAESVVATALEELLRRRELNAYTEFVTSGELDDLADPQVTRSAQRCTLDRRGEP